MGEFGGESMRVPLMEAALFLEEASYLPPMEDN